MPTKLIQAATITSILYLLMGLSAPSRIVQTTSLTIGQALPQLQPLPDLNSQRQ